MHGPVSFVAFLLFIVSLILGLFISNAISMFAVFLTFKTLSDKGSIGIVSSISNLFAGLIIPLPLFPQGVQNVINYLPFRFISDLPFRIYIGNVGITDGLIYIAIGLAWLVVLMLLGRALINSALRKTVIQGG